VRGNMPPSRATSNNADIFALDGFMFTARL